MSASTPTSDETAETKTDNNPYNKTYLRNHKEIDLPKKFGTNTATNDNVIYNKNRTDYKSIPKAKLFTIRNILSASDCDVLTKKTNKLGYVPISFEYPEDYRKCERVICKSFNLSSIIWNKIIPYFNRSDVEDIRPYGFGNKGIWRPTHINEAIRFTRYRNGDFFKSHRDGGYTKSNLNRSVYTIMIYLNDGSTGDFTGGETIFYSLKKPRAQADIENNENSDLFLTESDIKNALKVEIKPVKGMAVIFNHDIWHEGCVVNAVAGKHKFILRSDIMFECYSCETFNRDNLISDPLYIKSQMYYKLTIELQNKGLVRESTISYLKALSIQTTLPSVIIDKNNEYYGDEYYWLTNDVYEYILSFLDVYRLITVCYVSRAWNYYASSPNLWKKAYSKYFNIHEIQSMDTSIRTANITALFRPWKHIFSYRVMVKKEFPIVVLNFWLNGIEIGASSKKTKNPSKSSNKYYNNDQKLMNNNDCQYVPFVVSEYKEVNYWSWKPDRKETLFGRIVFTGAALTTYGYGFQSPKWVINDDAILNGLYFYKLLKQILYFPNIVLSLPSIMLDNKLFMLYLKYMLTKFNTEKKSKIFCLIIKNMEQEIAKYYKYKNCIIILNEHRSFSISVIKNGERIVADRRLMQNFLASRHSTKKSGKNNCFPKENGFFHYRDDFDSSFFISNVSDFDFISSVKQNINMLNENFSEGEQKQEAMPHLERYHPYSNVNSFQYINKSTTAPKPIVIDEKEEKNQEYYYKIRQKNEKLLNKMNEILKMNGFTNKKKYLNEYKLNVGDNDLVNDIYVGPNKGEDIAQNDDFAHLIYRNRYGGSRNNQNKEKIKRYHPFYQKHNAPFNNTLCYSPFDLILALNDVFKQCKNLNVFQEIKDEIPVILVGSLTNFYGDFIQQFCQLINDENNISFKVKYIAEYVQNEGTKDMKNRSSSLKQLLQSVVTPTEISNFKSISEIKNEIIVQTNKNEQENQRDETNNKQDDNNANASTKTTKTAKTTKTTKKKSKLGSIFKIFQNK